MKAFTEDVLGFIERNTRGAMPKVGRMWGGFEHWEFVGSGTLLLHARDPDEDFWEEDEAEDEWE